MADTDASRIEQWMQGGCPGPRTIYLFPTMRCNLQCGICLNDSIQSWGDLKQEIPDERLLALVDEAAALGARNWIIGGGGEPMVRGDLVIELCARIRAHGMNGKLQTNGTLLKERHIESLVRSGWKEITVSVDGPTAAICDAVRSKGAFEKAYEALRCLRETKRKYNATTPMSCVTMVLTSENYRTVSDMVAMCHELECGWFSVRDVMVLCESAKHYEIDASGRAALPAIIAGAHVQARQLGLNNNFEEYLQSLKGCPHCCGEHERIATTGALKDSPCYFPWHTLAIFPSGRVSPCCVFWEDDADSIRDMSLGDVWTGKYMTGVREEIQQHGLLELCDNCLAEFEQANDALREKLAWAEREREESSLTPWMLGKKAVRSLRRHGLAESFRRGKMWLKIQKDFRQGRGV